MKGSKYKILANNKASASFGISFASFRIFQSTSNKANGIEWMFRSVIDDLSFLDVIGLIACLIIG
jgi:hypothetical protein